MSIPSASEVESQEEQLVEEPQPELLTLEMMVEHLPNLDGAELIELMDKVNAVLKKKWKSQAGTKSKVKSQVEKPKKPASKALRRTQSWIPYVQKHAMDNGWEAFVIRQESKNKGTGETEVEEIEKSASVLNEATDETPAYTFKDAKTCEIITPTYVFADTGKHLIYKDAMSLSAKLKWREGVKPSQKFKDEDEERSHWSDLFQAFVDQYDEQDESLASSSSTASTPSSSPKFRRLTASEKEEEKEERKRIAEEEKERKRQEKEEEKERKRQEKEEEKRQKEEEKERKRLEKEEEKRQKEEDKERKRQEKDQKKSPPAAAVKKSPVPAAKAPVVKAVAPTPAAKTPTPAAKAATTATSKSATPVTPAAAAKPATTTTPSKAITPAKTTAPKALTKAKSEPEKMVWNCPEDDMVHKWTWQGKTYLVNHHKCVWEMLPSGDAGNWVGLAIPEENRIDTDYEEPEYEDDE